MPLPTEELQNKIGYRFRDPCRLKRAITHSSYANETGEKNHHLQCNERLEFLGDSVLSVVAGLYLYSAFPNAPEGELTRMRAALVCETSLASFARVLGLGDFLLLGRGEVANGGAQKPSILADAFEALLAAIYLDAEEDGIRAVSEFLIPYLKKRTESLSVEASDSKTLLQVFLQKDGACRPEYRLVGESGPDHAKSFSIEVYLDSNRIGTGTGSTKRHAEQEAAADALRLFGVIR